MLRGGIPFSNAPGIAYEYSNYGFAILGRIVANVSKMKYGDYVAANILKPLGMTVDDARAGGGAGRTGSRTAIAGRTRGGRTSRCCRTARSDRWAGC